jgi:hypothetical protein
MNKNNEITLFYQNITSYYSKIDLINILLNKIKSKFDIISFIETNLI